MLDMLECLDLLQVMQAGLKEFFLGLEIEFVTRNSVFKKDKVWLALLPGSYPGHILVCGMENQHPDMVDMRAPCASNSFCFGGGRSDELVCSSCEFLYHLSCVDDGDGVGDCGCSSVIIIFERLILTCRLRFTVIQLSYMVIEVDCYCVMYKIVERLVRIGEIVWRVNYKNITMIIIGSPTMTDGR